MKKEFNIEDCNPISKQYCTKGSIFWFSLAHPNPNVSSLKCRPFIIVSRTSYNSSRVLMSPIQDLENYIEDEKVKYPYHVPLLKEDYNFLEKDSVILLDQVYTVDKKELYKKCFIGKIEKFDVLDNAIIYNFNLYESLQKGITELLKQYKNMYSNKFSRK